MRKLTKEHWVLPTMAIKLINDLVSKGGETRETIKSVRKFAKTREAWIASIFLIGKMKLENRFWYLRGNEIENSSDDIYARSLWYEGSVLHSDNVLAIQVVRKTEHNPESLLEIVKKKITETDLTDVSLICYVMVDDVIDWKSLNEEINKLNTKTKDITFIGNLGDGKFLVGQAHPVVKVTEVDLGLSVTNDPSVVQMTEVYKPEETGVTKIGKALLVPTFEIKDLK